MRIRVNLQIFIFLIIFYLTKQMEVYSILMLFAIVHELGHLVCGILLGLRVNTMQIMPFGVSVYFEDYSHTYLYKKIIIAIAGPLTNFIIVLIGGYLEWNELVIYSNVLIGAFNLIPIYPLDGGRILKYVIEIKQTKQYAENIIHMVSNVLIIFLTAISSIGIMLLHNIAIVIILIYLWAMVISENKKYKLRKRVYGVMKYNAQE